MSWRSQQWSSRACGKRHKGNARIDPSGFTEEEPEGHWYSGFTNLFRSAPVAAVDMSSSLGSQVAAALAAMDFPNGNDAPNSSGCPNGNGSAPLPCAAPGAAGCSPEAGSLEGLNARYIKPLQLSLDLPTAPGTTVERPSDLGELEWEYEALLSELTTSAAADALVDEVWEIRTDPVKKDEFAQALWGHFVTKYEEAVLRLGVDLLVQGGLGVLVSLVARGGTSSSSYVYQLVDDAGEPVYYGISNNPVTRLGRHALEPPGPFRGMQVISGALPRPQALSLETSLIRQAQAEGRMIYNIAESSISPSAPIAVPPTTPPTHTMLNPVLYPR